jgi:hypothetical protein
MSYFNGILLAGMLGVAIISLYRAVRKDRKKKRDQNPTNVSGIS